MSASDTSSNPLGPAIEEAESFWHEVGKDIIRKSIDPVNESAKQIIGVTSILEGLYFNAITFSNLHNKISFSWLLAIYVAPVGLLLISLGAALMVFLPKRYTINFLSTEGSRLVYETMINRKMRLLKIAASFLVLAISALLLAVIIYLIKGL